MMRRVMLLWNGGYTYAPDVHLRSSTIEHLPGKQRAPARLRLVTLDFGDSAQAYIVYWD